MKSDCTAGIQALKADKIHLNIALTEAEIIYPLDMIRDPNELEMN